ncbi:hypothetical protein CHS0354_004768 [Potamilus streckersoni]|uniref:Transmembrane protein n=1 Tax=Potamilus streckersoni TaxID=2493646 RepID=A0AAE0TDX0_9BIVA|nr:hypothetical protein CHS0354_004768 [Potamilus streckersoni]
MFHQGRANSYIERHFLPVPVMDGTFFVLQWPVLLLVVLMVLPNRGQQDNTNEFEDETTEGRANVTYENATPKAKSESNYFPKIFFSSLALVILCTCAIGLSTCVRKARANARRGRRGQPDLSMVFSVVLDQRLADTLRRYNERNMEMDSEIPPMEVPWEPVTYEIKLPLPPPYEEVQTVDQKPEDPPPSYSDSVKDNISTGNRR